MMKRLGKMLAFGIGQIALTVLIGVLSFRVAVGAWPDPEADLGFLRILNGGSVTWKIGAAGNNNLSFIDNATSGTTVLTLYPGAAGGLGIASRTDTQLTTDVPGAKGVLVFDSTTSSVCVSSGTGGGAWIYPSTGPNTAAQRPCHT